MGDSLRGILMDLDGTLYHQRPLRVRMLLELALAPFTRGPGRAVGDLRRLKLFREMREDLRELGRPEERLVELQYSRPAERLGVEAAAVAETVHEWIHRRPLRHLVNYRRDGLVEFLRFARGEGLELGVFSDYPAEEKLEALGIRELFSLVVGATDDEVNAFKPHPRGFAYACERWGFAPEEVLYVGDRAEVDGEGARAAGMPVALLAADDGGTYVYCRDIAELEAEVRRRGVGGAPGPD